MKTKLDLVAFDYKILCDKGQKFADMVFARFPETKRNAFMFKDKDETWNPSLWLKSPKGEDRDIEFFVDEASGQAFRWTTHYAAHFSDFDSTEKVFECVDRIRSDQDVLCVSILGGEWQANLLTAADDALAIEDFVKRWGKTVTIYSFKGTRDREVKV